MRIDGIATISETQSHDIAGKTVLVIDVLRATSVIATALENGARQIIPVETVAQAKNIGVKEDVMTGERQCKKIPGFMLGNSPLEFSPQAVEGRRIVMTTTNGTRGIQKAVKGFAVIAASFLNAAACADAAAEIKKDIVILCAGTQDAFALEDGLCAGLLVKELRSRIGELRVNDFARSMELAYAAAEPKLAETLLACESGGKLSALGFREDVSYCAQVNALRVVPILKDGALRQYGKVAQSQY